MQRVPSFWPRFVRFHRVGLRRTRSGLALYRGRAYASESEVVVRLPRPLRPALESRSISTIAQVAGVLAAAVAVLGAGNRCPTEAETPQQLGDRPDARVAAQVLAYPHAMDEFAQAHAIAANPELLPLMILTAEPLGDASATGHGRTP
jgi:hypothetical protein